MKTKASNDIRNTQKDHQDKMKRLNSHHKNELDAVKNKHVQNRNNLSASNQDQLHLQRVNHDSRLFTREVENEKTFTKLQENLDSVKDRIQKTKADLEVSHENDKKNQRAIHSTNLELSNQTNSLKMKDANDITAVELNRLRRMYRSEKDSLKNSSLNEKNLLKASQKNETEIDKHVFRKKHAYMTDENARALFKIKADHSRVKTREERKNLKEITQRRDIWGSTLTKIDEDGAQIKSAKQSEFEKDYAVQYKKHEELGKTLMRNKEKIVKKFTDELTTQFEIGAAKSEDEFYKFGKLEVNISENQAGNGYDILIPVKEHEASNIKLVGENRNIRITMEREYSDTLKTDDQENKMSKIETYTTKKSVADIIDPATITKNYEGDNLVFRVLKA